MLESILIAIIVGIAAVYAVWALLPAPSRRNVATRLARALGGPNAPGVAGQIAASLQRTSQSSCGCSDCPAATLTPAERARRGE